VLEHLPRPVDALRRLAGLAAPGGRLVVEVPIAENGATNDISGFFSVYHVTHFSRAGLERALHAAGWSVAEWCEMDDYNGCRVVAARGGGDPAAADADAYARCLSAWRESAARAEERLAEIGPRCLIWGAGSHTEMLYHVTSFFQAAPEREYRLVDRDPLKAGGTWRGIRPPSRAVGPSRIPTTASSTSAPSPASRRAFFIAFGQERRRVGLPKHRGIQLEVLCVIQVRHVEPLRLEREIRRREEPQVLPARVPRR